MFVPTPPYGFKSLVYQWKFTNKNYIKKNVLYTCKATAINQEGVIVTYSFVKKEWIERHINRTFAYPFIQLRASKFLLDLKNKWHLDLAGRENLETGIYTKYGISIHRAVYFTFHPKFKDLKYYDMSGKVIHHKDGDKDNPNFDNLSEITQSENTLKHNRFYKKGQRLKNIQQRIMPRYNPNINQLKLNI